MKVSNPLIIINRHKMSEAELAGDRPRPVIWLLTGSKSAYSVKETSRAKITGLNNSARVIRSAEMIKKTKHD
jgi:hypothetical protein